MRFLLAGFAAVIALFGGASNAWETGTNQVVFKWPSVKSLDESFRFPDASKAHIRVLILGMSGKPLYKFACDAGFKFSDGSIENLECYLNEPYSQDEPDLSLLNDDPFDGAAAHSRGEIWAGELVGHCAEYPEWGRVRTFKLRGMQLRIEIKDVAFAKEENPTEGALPEEISALRSLTLKIGVLPDPKAVSAIADPVPYSLNWAHPGRPFDSTLKCTEPIQVHVPGVVSNDYLVKQKLLPPFQSIVPKHEPFQISGEWHSSYAPTPTPAEPMFFVNKPIPPSGRIVYFPISDPAGGLTYEFECTATSGGPLNPKIDQYGISCGLFLHGGAVNLLEDAVDPYSRMMPSQILPDQLYGECANYPQWGTHRVFRLRGFRLTMQFSDPVFTQSDFFPGHALKRVTLNIKVERDPAATEPVALPSKYIYWGIVDRPDACNTVLINPRLSGNNKH